MDKYDLLEAMSGIRDEFIVEAAAPETEQIPASGSRFRGKRNRRSRILHLQTWAATAAALLCLSILVPNLNPDAASALRGIPLLGGYFRTVTFRGTEQKKTAFSTERMADSSMPQEDAAEEERVAASGGMLAAQEFEEAETSGAAFEALEMAEEDPGEGTMAVEAGAAVREAVSGASIPEELLSCVVERVSEYERQVEEETGFASLRFQHEVVTDSDTWFCLEVRASTSISEGFEETVHFNFDKSSCRLCTLKDLFPEGTEYRSMISAYIISQMRAQMNADPEMEYNIAPRVLNEGEVLFEGIRPEQDFYLTDDGSIVIFFNEMEAAPMYMGTLEFLIPEEVTAQILQ